MHLGREEEDAQLQKAIEMSLHECHQCDELGASSTPFFSPPPPPVESEGIVNCHAPSVAVSSVSAAGDARSVDVNGDADELALAIALSLSGSAVGGGEKDSTISND